MSVAPRLADRAPPTPPAPAPAPAPRPRADRLFDAATAAIAATSVVLLARQAAGARFFTDECFHAHVATRIAAEGALPVTLPAFYSGMPGSYPPLFHALGALWSAGFGPAALPWLNVAVWGVLLALLLGGLGAGLPRPARRGAALLCVASHWLSLHALRFYAEMTFAALALAAALLALRLHRTGRVGEGVLLGLAAGSLALAKPAGAIAAVALAAAAAVAAARRSPRAVALAWGAAAALAVAAPWWIRNQLRFGSVLHPLGAPDLDPGLWAMHLARYEGSWLRYAERLGAGTGPWIALAAALALGLAWRRPGPPVVLLAGCLAAAALAPLLPVHDPRHVLPLLPLAAAAACAVLFAAAGAARWRWVEVALLMVAAVHLARLPDYRRALDLPPHLGEAYAAARALPAGSRLLSLWTYDTAFHTGRAATWPIPWGPSRTLAPLLETGDPDRLLAGLERHGVDAILMPVATGAAAFDGSNYPAGFVRAVRSLVATGRLRVAWASPRVALVVRRAAGPGR